MKDIQIMQNEELITFLERAKNGEYAPIDKKLLEYTRIEEETFTLDLDTEEEFYYSIS